MEWARVTLAKLYNQQGKILRTILGKKDSIVLCMIFNLSFTIVKSSQNTISNNCNALSNKGFLAVLRFCRTRREKFHSRFYCTFTSKTNCTVCAQLSNVFPLCEEKRQFSVVFDFFLSRITNCNVCGALCNFIRWARSY